MKNSKRKIIVPKPMVEVRGVCLKCAARGVCGIITSLKTGGTMASCTRFVSKPQRQKIVKVKGFTQDGDMKYVSRYTDLTRYSDHN